MLEPNWEERKKQLAERKSENGASERVDVIEEEGGKKAFVAVEWHERLNTNKYYFWINRMQTELRGAQRTEHVLH